MDKNMLTALVNRKERAKVKVKRKHAPSSHSSTSSKPKLTKKPKQRWVYLRITLKSKNFVFKNFPLQTPCKDSTQGSILPGWVVRHKRTIIKATRDFKAFYGFKASAWYKDSRKPYHSAAVTATLYTPRNYNYEQERNLLQRNLS